MGDRISFKIKSETFLTNKISIYFGFQLIGSVFPIFIEPLIPLLWAPIDLLSVLPWMEAFCL